MNVDELALLRKLVADEPVDAGVARTEVWRRLNGENVRAGDRRRRIVTVLVAAVVLVVAAASAFAAARELYFDPRAPRKESRTVDGIEFTFTVPSGSWENGPILKVGESSSGEPEFRAGDVFISKSLDMGQAAEVGIFWTAFPDGGEAAPCRRLLGQHIGGSSADLAKAMTTASGIRIVHRPVRTTVGGRPATHLVLRVRKDRGCDPGYFFTWKPRGREGAFQAWGALWVSADVGDTFRVWIVDVEGKRLVLAAWSAQHERSFFAGTRAKWAQAQGDIESIIRSIRFR
jgi:hypothetical protein